MSKKQIDERLLYPVLFSRLKWPSLYVQERAADSIASLLVDINYSSAVLDHLFHWIASQQLESVAVKGILVLLRARILDQTYHGPSLKYLLKIFPKQSLLSWLLFDAYNPQINEPLPTSLINSGKPPSDFLPDPFFEKYITNFLPPIYDHLAKQIEQRTSFPFRLQWAFEWKSIVNNYGIIPSTGSMNHFWGAEHSGIRYSPIDTEMSEVYRSAYLRVLAYAVQYGYMEEAALLLAAKACPIDLELWKMPPQKRPSWWPNEVTINLQTDNA